MHSKIFSALISLNLLACGVVSEKENFFPTDGTVGVQYSTSNFNSGGTNQTQSIFFIDKVTNAVNKFGILPFSFQSRTEVNKKAKKVLSHPNGKFVIALSPNGYEIITETQNHVRKLNALPGDLVSVAFDPSQNTLVLQDSLRSLFIIFFKDTGEIEKSWIGGPRIADSKILNAGALVAGRRLLLSLGSSKLALVDLNATIEKQAWTSEVLTVADTKNISWVSYVPESQNIVLLGDENQLLSYNLQTKAVIEKVDLNGYGSLGLFSEGHPHLIGQKLNIIAEIDKNFVIYSEEKPMKVSTWSSDTAGHIRTLEYGLPAQRFVSSWLNTDDNEIAMLGCLSECAKTYEEPFVDGALYRFRISDGLLIKKVRSRSKAQWSYRGQSTVLSYPSVLGYAEHYTNDEEEPELLKAFNKKALNR